jgi:hypothetical protein
MVQRLLEHWRDAVERWCDDIQEVCDYWLSRRKLVPQVVVVRAK